MRIMRSILAGALAAGLVLPSVPARADTPAVVVVVVVGGGEAAAAAGGMTLAGTLGAAAIGALGAIGAAWLGSEGKVETKEPKKADAPKGGSGSKRTTAPSTDTTVSSGTSQGFMPVGELPKTVGEYIRQRAGRIGYGTYAGSLALTAEYSFEGDVLSAPPAVGTFVHTRTFTFDLDVKGDKANATTAIALFIKELELSTKDLPGSVGYSQLTIRTVSGKASKTWRARVDQGKRPRHDEVVTAAGSIKAARDSLRFTKPAYVEVPVEIGASKEGKVRITITYEGSGARI